MFLALQPPIPSIPLTVRSLGLRVDKEIMRALGGYILEGEDVFNKACFQVASFNNH